MAFRDQWRLVGVICAGISFGACGDFSDLTPLPCDGVASAGCPCYGNGSCDHHSDGSALTCHEERCVLATCAPGSDGCDCRLDGGCDAGLRCAAADGELRCEAACDAGELGCPCVGGSLCLEADGRVPLSCVQGVCEAACDAGSLDCVCDRGRCGLGLACAGGACERDSGQSLAPPTAPACYTPCRGDLVEANGRVRVCSQEGLLPGCIAGRICLQGSCVVPLPPGARTATVEGIIPTCDGGAQCPDHQACIGRHCYSDCTADGTVTCREGRQCHRNACRRPCSAAGGDGPASDGATCPSDEVCDSDDGQQGFCMPVAPPGAVEAPADPTRFFVAPNSIRFTPTASEGAFAIANASPDCRRFVVSRAVHREFGLDEVAEVTDNALHWVSLTADAGPTSCDGGVEDVQADPKAATLTLAVPADGERVVTISGVDNPELPLWEGELRVADVAGMVAPRPVRLRASSTPKGQWQGRMLTFSSFPKTHMSEWIRDCLPTPSGPCRDTARLVGNAFLQRWNDFRQGLIPYDELEAVLKATETGSWDWPSVRQACVDAAGAPDPNRACYLYDNAIGIAEYSSSLRDSPVPTGVTELRFMMNIRPPTSPSAAPGAWSGRVVSSHALQYPGDPSVAITFAGDPAECSDTPGDDCLTFLRAMEFSSDVGARWRVADDAGCAPPAPSLPRPRKIEVPLLVPGFRRDVPFNAEGRRPTFECRDEQRPFAPTPEGRARNGSMSGANPYTDGEVFRRTVRLIDGVMVNQSRMVLLVEEEVPSTLGPDRHRSMGVVILERADAFVPSVEYAGATPPALGPRRVPTGAGECSDELKGRLRPSVGRFHSGNADRWAGTLLTGRVPGAGPPTLGDGEKAHYLCHDRGEFDAGPSEDKTCPAESKVTFFTLTGAPDGFVRDHPCQGEAGICRPGQACESRGCVAGELCGAHVSACEEALRELVTARQHSIRLNPRHTVQAAPCGVSPPANDRRRCKLFEGGDDGAVLLPDLEQSIADAFRYESRFRNREGRSVGFAPVPCEGDDTPYCYDPRGIEEIQQRVDCLIEVHRSFADRLSADRTAQVTGFLRRSFSSSQTQEVDAATPLVTDGFETQRAKLLVMLGDEAYTKALGSRFDLAGQLQASFPGSVLEPGGVDLSGGAGFEMLSLYSAVQHYDMALSRFFELKSSLNNLIQAAGVITPATASSWLTRLLRASAQKARAYGQIAERYQQLDRTELARHVVERAYTAATLEAIVFMEATGELAEGAPDKDKAHIQRQLALAQSTFGASLAGMIKTYERLDEDLNAFGYTADFVPFPALDPLDVNAFEKVLGRARQKAATAADKEEIALLDRRRFDTDSAEFQRTLASIQDEHEDALSEICGRISVPDASGGESLYPAIPQYAHLHPWSKRLGDPCGLVRNGQLHDAFLELNKARLDARIVKQAVEILQGDLTELDDRLAEQCDRISNFQTARVAKGGEITTIAHATAAMEATISSTDRAMDRLDTNLELLTCDPPTVGTAASPGNCPIKGAALGIWTGVTVAQGLLASSLEASIAENERALSKAEIALEIENLLVKAPKRNADGSIQRDANGKIVYEAEPKSLNDECETEKIDTFYEKDDVSDEISQRSLEALRVQEDIRTALSQVLYLRNDALAIREDLAEFRELAIDVEAARNDPNVRIYRNDAVFNADRTFDRALREAYKATKVYEYYTSQSYGRAGDLFLVRMVARGDITLESYLDDLDDAFEEFEQQFGNPDLRVMKLSLLDDIFAIPRLDESGGTLTMAQRTQRLRQALASPALLDDRGYITKPFGTTVKQLSPLTRNHKVRFIEAEIVGQQDLLGDHLGRVYLRQRGTGILAAVDDSKVFFKLPERTAVLNPFFNGQRRLEPAGAGVLTPSVYRSERLRDRPLINTTWDFVLNLKDEQVNGDLDLAGLQDIRLFVYYTDFTAL